MRTQWQWQWSAIKGEFRIPFEYALAYKCLQISKYTYYIYTYITRYGNGPRTRRTRFPQLTNYKKM